MSSKQNEHPQRHSIFKTRCTVRGKVCDLIIDSGSTENIVSRSMVKKLGLETEWHPSPYKIGWIKKGAEIAVSETCRVMLSNRRNYADKILCDVVDMDACHIIWEGHGNLILMLFTEVGIMSTCSRRTIRKLS